MSNKSHDDRFRRSLTPQTRESRIADAMTKVMDAHPEYDEADRAIILYMGPEMSTTVLSGYDHDDEDRDAQAMAEMVMHLRAIFAANGITLSLVPIKGRGEG